MLGRGEGETTVSDGRGRPPAFQWWIGLGISLAAQAWFYSAFIESVWQPSVDLAWLIASAAWFLTFWRPDRPSLPRLPQPWGFYLFYVVCLLPFCTNWRWAMTGDTLSWLFFGIDVFDNGPSKSFLSAYGPDQFGFLQMLVHNSLMIAVSPTIFWHRVGKICIAVVAAASIYTVFARLVRPAFGLLVTACTVSCSVWIVYVHSPFPYFDGIAGAFSLLAIALWIRRDPESTRAWLLLGGVSGLMLFLTMNGWFMALVVWTWMTGLVLLRRCPLRLYLLGLATGAVIGGPMLFQWIWGTGGKQFDLVHSPQWTIEKVHRFFREAALMPFSSPLFTNGAMGPQLPWGFRWLFPPGALIALLFFRRLPGAGLILLAYVVHLIGLVFTQGPYESVSPKRALILIPMATYFVFLPFQRWIRSYLLVLPIVGLWAGLGIYDVVARIEPGVVGYTLLDGAIEVHQRMSDVERICFYLPEDPRGDELREGSMLDRLYDFRGHLAVVDDINDPACREALCYATEADRKHVDLAAAGYTPLRMRNTHELACGRRTPAIR